MKILILPFLLGTISLFAQEKLVVEYENRTEVDLSKETNPKIIQMLKLANETKFDYQLITTKDESSFKKIDKIDNTQRADGMKITFNDTEKHLYKNFKTNQSLTFDDYNGKRFVIQDSLRIQPWILSKEKSTFLGYEVKKASYERDGLIYEAWYAPKLNFKNGPEDFSGLPGIILKVEITNNEAQPSEKTYYTATKVELNSKVLVTKPTKGQLISAKDYKTFTDEEYRKYIESQKNKLDKKID